MKKEAKENTSLLEAKRNTISLPHLWKSKSPRIERKHAKKLPKDTVA